METLKKGDFLLTAAHAVAKGEIAKGLGFCVPIEKWGDGKTLWVASSEDDVFATQVIMIDGHKVFIGSKK